MTKLVYLFLVELLEVLQLSILALKIDILGVNLIHVISQNLILLVRLLEELDLFREFLLELLLVRRRLLELAFEREVFRFEVVRRALSRSLGLQALDM